MPIAIGSRPKLAKHRLCNVCTHPGPWSSQPEANDTTSAVPYRTPTIVAATAIHLICCRSSPVARRNRITRLTTAATTPMGMTMPPTVNQDSQATPNGFVVPGNPSIVPGENRMPIDPAIMPAASSRANHRQRGDGRCPSGKRSNRNVAGRTTMGIHSHDVSPAIAAPNGALGWT